MMKIIIQYKGDIDRTDLSGKTPLTYAIMNNEKGIIHQLLVSGASPLGDKNGPYLKSKKEGWASMMLTAAIKVSCFPVKTDE